MTMSMDSIHSLILKFSYSEYQILSVYSLNNTRRFSYTEAWELLNLFVRTKILVVISCIATAFVMEIIMVV